MASAAVTSAGRGNSQQASAHSSQGNPNNGDQSGASKVRGGDGTPIGRNSNAVGGANGLGGPAKPVGDTSRGGGGGSLTSVSPAMSSDQKLTGPGGLNATDPDLLSTLARGGIAGPAARATPPSQMGEQRLPPIPAPPPLPSITSLVGRTAALTEQGLKLTGQGLRWLYDGTIGGIVRDPKTFMAAGNLLSPAADIAGLFDGSTKGHNVAQSVEAHPGDAGGDGSQTAAVAMLASGAGEIVDGLGFAAKTGLEVGRDAVDRGIGSLVRLRNPLIAYALSPEEDPDVFDTARWAAARAFKAAVEQHAKEGTVEGGFGDCQSPC